MRLLAIRVGPAGPAVAVLGGAGGPVERDRPGARAEALAALVGEAMAAARLGFAELEALAVLTGPGGFTAARAAVAAARALALATGLRVHALSALELAAEALVEGRGGEPVAEPFLALAPAGRGELVLQRFDGGAAPLGPPRRLDAAAARAAVGEAPLVALVDLDEPPGPVSGPPPRRLRSSALGLARAAAARHARGLMPRPGAAVRPLYLRPPDARPEAGRALVAAR